MFRTYIFCLLLLQLVISCKDQKATSEIIKQSETPLENQIIEVSKKQFANNGMRIDTLKQLSFPTTIKTTGIIDVPPSNKAVISAVMGG
ncbi:MAG: efflux transporter periplasmic adaptor subunit, partial [Eudoraea sp.]